MDEKQSMKRAEKKTAKPSSLTGAARRFRARWIFDLIFATAMFAIAAVTVTKNPTMLYFLMSAFWFILAAWDRYRLNEALKTQPGQ